MTILPPISKRLVATTTTDLFEPYSPWSYSLEARAFIRGGLIMPYKDGGFRCRLGIETAEVHTFKPNAPTAITSYSSYISTASADGNFFSFDPNGASDGNIDAGLLFRVGILYSLASAGTGQGEVELRLSWD